jgi:ATP-dependent DNA ligase
MLLHLFLYAFDLIELNGDDLRRDPLQVRKATLASILAKARPGTGSMSISKLMAQPFEELRKNEHARS